MNKFFFLFFFFFLSCVYSPNNTDKMINLSETEWVKLHDESEESVIMDVRTDDEFSTGYISGAVNIDFYMGNEFISEIDKLDKSKSYFIYCKSGARSGQTCELMKQKGFKKVYNLEGGILGWTGELEEL
ncbi:MAG: rhodanese-like domain-containing protein [Bacteroidota bacterium]|nr:rhodanese-like domain-containing protein [Bacteroidota bacterium]